MIEAELLHDDARTAAAIRTALRRWLHDHHQKPTEGSDFVASLHLVRQVRQCGGDPGPIISRARLEIQKSRHHIIGVERALPPPEEPDVPEVPA